MNPLKIILAQGISQTCDRLMMIASLWILAVHAQPQWAAWFVAAASLPHLLLFRWTPGLIDHFGALKSVIYSDLARAVVLIVASVFFSGEWQPTWLYSLFGIYFFINFFTAIFNPAMFVLPSLLFNTEDEKRKLMAQIESVTAFSNVVAPVISTSLFYFFGFQILMLVNGLSYLLAWFLEVGIVVKQKSDQHSLEVPQKRPSIGSVGKRDFLIVYLLVGFLFLNLVLGPLLVLIPLYANKIYLGTIKTVSIMELFLALGSLIGSILASTRYSGKTSFKKIFAFLIMNSIGFIGFCFSKSLTFGTVGLFTLGFFLSLANVMILDLFQKRAIESELSLVMNYVNVIGTASLPISLVVFGAVLTSTGDQWVLLGKIVSLISLVFVLLLGIGPVFVKRLKM